MDNIVFLEPNKIDSEPFTTSKVIAEMTGIEHRKIKVTIRKYQSDINSFGLSASYQAESTGGRPEEIIKMNEAQATFVPCCPFEKFIAAYDRVMKFVKDGRKADGKDPEPAYITVNVDEPYSHEVIDTLKKHGDWGQKGAEKFEKAQLPKNRSGT